MGLFDKLKGELIDIIEWLDDTNNTMVYRFERYGNEIKNGAKLVVRETQKAVFIDQGQLADVFDPGTYTLTTENLPILTTLKGWKYGFNSPFKAEVYFVNTRIFTDLKWGTPNPIMLRDPEFGPIRIRARGNYTIRVVDPTLFIREITGTDAQFSHEEISNHLRNIMITLFTDMLGEAKIPVLDLAANYNELSLELLKKTKIEFQKYGIDTEKTLIENITLPEEVEKALDARSSMGILGNLNAYTQYQAANSIKDFAQNESGAGNLAGAGMGMGMGMAMGNTMGTAFQNPNQQQGSTPSMGATPPPPPPMIQYYAYINNEQKGPLTLNELKTWIQNRSITPETMVWKAGMANWEKAQTITELAGFFTATPPPPPPIS